MRGRQIWACAVVVVALIAVIGDLGIPLLSVHAESLQRPSSLPPASSSASSVPSSVVQSVHPLTHPLTPLTPHLGYGINVRLEGNIGPLFTPLGLEWIKLWEEYEHTPPDERLPYQVLFAVDCRDGMPEDLETWGDEIETIATAGLGRVEAYEICNEPNVERFWGGRPPDPAQYVQMLQVAYERIKAVDRNAIIVSGGLAPVGRIEGTCNGWNGNNCGAMDEREYTRQMLLLGAGDYFDAFGYHPYGFAYEPETDPHSVSNGFAFRGAEVMHDLLGQYGLDRKPLWATEFNWLRDWTEDGGMPAGCRDEYEAVFGWMEMSEVQQANYITRAYQYADDNWPWMGAMFVWNLDWHNYNTWDCEAARYFAVRRNDGTAQGAPTLAYNALATMEKRPGHFGPMLAIEPPALSFLADIHEPGVITGVVVPINTGYRVLTWTASVATGMQVTGTGTVGVQVTPTLAITTGLQGCPLTVTVDSTGYTTGTFIGLISVTATLTDVLGSPQIVPVMLRIVPQLRRVYLPLTLRTVPCGE